MTGHPRLYFTAEELQRLRALRTQGTHARIWNNLRESAERCLELTPRQSWIAPVSPDPIYENLYDRFYAIMSDLAITEHLAFAYAYSGEQRSGDAARQWVLASCRAWQKEADTPPDGGKAYAVCRLLKGLALGYDCLAPLWSEAEQLEIRETIARIGQTYYDQYFTTEKIAGPGFHTHHAIVEWASFGVAALALLGEHQPAAEWLDACIRKFEEHLLPHGLAPDGAQVEGATFWASTMQDRLFFMDALRRVTGRDLFAPHAESMNADLALAGIAAEKFPGPDEDHQTVILEPAYGQLNYYSPVLLALAREYRRPIYQHLALWDHSFGALQETRYTTPHGERLRFELGGYAYARDDPSVPAAEDGSPRHFHFPSVDEAYLRESWQPNDLVVGVRRGEVVIHAGGRLVLAEPAPWQKPAVAMSVRRAADEGTQALIECASDDGTAALRIELHRPGRLVVRRRARTDWSWWCEAGMVSPDSTLIRVDHSTRSAPAVPQPLWWIEGRGTGQRVSVRLLEGSIALWEPEGYRPEPSVANGLLKLCDPDPRRYPRVTLSGNESGTVALEITVQDHNTKVS